MNDKITGGKWYADGEHIIDEDGNGIMRCVKLAVGEAEANSEFACICANQCHAINPPNPMAVVQNIQKMWEVLGKLYAERVNIGTNKPFWTPGNKELLERLLSDMEANE